MKAIIYARVSTDKQRDNYSISSQIRTCEKYALEHGYTIVGDRWVNRTTGYDTNDSMGSIRAYVDDYTGTSIYRPMLGEVENYLLSSGFDVLLVYSLDRLSRDPIDRGNFERKLHQHNVQIIYVTGDYDDTPIGDLRKGIDGNFVQYQNAQRVRDSTRGRIDKALRGEYVGLGVVHPYGFKKDKSALGGLAIVEIEAVVIRNIYQWYSEGLSLSQIATRLNDEGVKPRRSKNGFSSASVYNILVNDIYAGIAYYGRTKKVRGVTTKVPKNEWIPIKVTPIVSMDVFERVRTILKRNRDAKRRPSIHFYLLQGMVYCGQCERPYSCISQTRGNNKVSQNYRHIHKSNGCRNHHISAKKLNPKVWDAVIGMLSDTDTLLQGHTLNVELSQQGRVHKKKHLNTLDRERERIEAKRERLTAVYIDPDIPLSKDEYIKQKTMLDDEIRTIKNETSDIEYQLAQIIEPQDLESFTQWANEISRGVGGGVQYTDEEKREILSLLDIRVKIEKEQIEITGEYGLLLVVS